MSANPERRALITDTAIEILARSGAGGLSHRVVDTEAGLPAGTTSNFFRNRLALLKATAQRMAELHWLSVAETRSRLGVEPSREGMARLLGNLISDSDELTRTRHLARFELFLEGNRHPELRSILEEIQTAAMQQAAVVLSSGGLPANQPDRVRTIGRLLNGLAFDQLILPGSALTPDEASALINRLLDLVFD
jgi:DNA-binding transcriptional regulator YbjK